MSADRSLMSRKNTDSPVVSGPSSGPLRILADAVRLIAREPGALLLFLVAGGIGYLSQLLGSILTIVLTVALIAWLYGDAGGKTTTNDSFLVTAFNAVLASLVAGVIILVGLAFLILPGIWLAIRLRLVVLAVVIEGAGPLKAISRSLSITEHHAMTIFGVAAVFFVVNLAILAPFAYHFGVFEPGPIEMSTLRPALRTGTVVTTTVVTPVSIAADVVMYGIFQRNTGVGTGGESSTSSGTAVA